MSRPSIPVTFAWLLLSVLSAGSMAYYTVAIWSSNQPDHFSDFYAPWWGTHELLLHRRNPYSPDVAHEIQTYIYGAPVAPSSDDPAGIGGGFAYPPYAALLLWPLVGMSFSAAQTAFFCLSMLALLLSFVIWMSALRLRAPPLQYLVLAIFAVGSFPALQVLKLLNLSVIAAAFLAITLYFLSRERLVLAGVFLAASTFKPQFAVILVLWLAVWTLADWRRRRSLAGSFLSTMIILGTASEWLVPGWIPKFLTVTLAYRHYTYGHSLLDVWFTPAFGAIAAGVLILSVVAVCWPYRSLPATSERFLLVASLLLAATVVVIPTLAPHAQLLLLPGWLFLFHRRQWLWSSTQVARPFLLAAMALLAWPWIVASALSAASLLLPTAQVARFWEVPLYTSPVLPLAVLIPLAWLLRRLPATPDQV